jgi:hypothetical protein
MTLSEHTQSGTKVAYREDDITPVHDDHDHSAHAGEVVEVRQVYQGHGDDVMGHHLPVIFPMGLCLGHEDQMGVESRLSDVVELHWSGEQNMRVPDPQRVQICDGRGQVQVDVLWSY